MTKSLDRERIRNIIQSEVLGHEPECECIECAALEPAIDLILKECSVEPDKEEQLFTTKCTITSIKEYCKCKNPFWTPRVIIIECAKCGKPIAEEKRHPCKRCINKDMPCAEGEVSCSGFKPEEQPQIEEWEDGRTIGDLRKKDKLTIYVFNLTEKLNELIRSHRKLWEAVNKYEKI